MNTNRAYHGTLSPQRCPVCPAVSNIRLCGDCRAVSYCSLSYCSLGHKSSDRPKHQSVCDKIKRTREKLQEEEAKMRSLFLPQDVFADCVGHFWRLLDTRDYMMARYTAAKTLLEANTLVAAKKALEHFNDMLRLDRDDHLKMRNYVSGLLLRLGQEQRCYDFLNRWHDIKATKLSHAVIRNSVAFEPVDKFRNGDLTLSQLASLALLKLRGYLDLHHMEQKLGSTSRCGHGYSDYTCPLDRPLGQIAKAWVRSSKERNLSNMAHQIRTQYFMLCQMVHDVNQHFWQALICTETPALPPRFRRYAPGSRELADVAVFHCKASWEESEGALATIKEDASQWFGVYDTRRPVEVAPKGTPIRRGTGETFPSQAFLSVPESNPGDYYNLDPSESTDGGAARFLHRNQPSSILLYTDGACSNNGQYNPLGGWAVVYGPAKVASGRLEYEGPFGEECLPTSNRAELRAVIAALRLCDWRGDGFDSITIATDSSYVVDGTTSWIQAWLRNGWKTGTGRDVKNKDLWEVIQGEVERWAQRGLSVHFLKIPRKWNTEADAAAKRAVSKAPVVKFNDVTIQCLSRATSAEVLVLCLEQGPPFDTDFGFLLKRFSYRAKLLRATTPEAAIRMLSLENRPSTILITDPAITRQRNVFESVSACLRQGTTVVLCGFFSSMVHADEFRCFFAKLGLPWIQGSYHQATVRQLIHKDIEFQVSRYLPQKYTQKAVFVKNLNKSAAWYVEQKSSDEAAVAFVRVGQGMLGYIGDVNGEQGSTSAALAMCGLWELLPVSR